MMPKKSLEKLLPKGWKLTHYNDTGAYSEGCDVIVAEKGDLMLSLKTYIDREQELYTPLLEVDLYGRDTQFNDGGWAYQDTLLGSYWDPEDMKTGEAQRQFAKVVENFDRTGRLA
jgi:hypothetical protein